MANRTFLATALAMLLAAIAAFAPGTAAAQTFPCTWGPGEVQVGENNGVPLCQQRGGGGGGAPAVRYYNVDSHLAAASHPDASDVWMVTGFHSEARAVRAALELCNRAMGSGCTIAMKSYNNTLAVARGTAGERYYSTHDTRGKAERAVLDYCRKQNDECELRGWVSASAGTTTSPGSVRENPKVFAPQGDYRKVYAAAAWADSNKIGNRIWTGETFFSGGNPTAEAAAANAKSACEAALALPCVAIHSISDTFYAVTAHENGSVRLSPGYSARNASDRAMAECRKVPGKCTAAGTFAARQQGVVRLDPLQSRRPLYAAVAWVKDKAANQSWADALWTNSGAASEAEARTGAETQCRNASKLNCDFGTVAFNEVIVIYRDNQDMIRTSALALTENSQRAIAAKCSAKKITCRIVATIDARVAATRQIDAR